MIKTNNLNTIKTRQKFDQTFKREAVNNWLTSGKSASVVAVELGILSEPSLSAMNGSTR
jgi:transposase-like protein